MSVEIEKAKLVLRLIGPLEGDSELPIGAAAWITSEDDEPIVVNLTVGYSTPPPIVAVSPGRVVIVLRVPGGRRGQYTLNLQPGELKEIEFGKVQNNATNEFDPFSDSLIGRDFVDSHNPEQNRPDGQPRQPRDPWGPADPLGGGFGGNQGGGWGGQQVGGTFGQPTHPPFGPPVRPQDRQIASDSWMQQINAVQLVCQKSARGHDGRLERVRLTQMKIPREIEAIQSSPEQLQFKMANCVAMIVRPVAPFHDNVLLHRAPFNTEQVEFKIKLRNDDSHIPFDTDIILSDDCITPLLAFLATSDLTSATAQADRFAKSAQNYMTNESGNHHMAAVGAYALYLLRQNYEYIGLFFSLYEQYRDISDGAIIWALTLMRSRPGAIAEWYDAARGALISATKRPLPILTIGIRMLVEGLERLSSSRRSQGDEELAKALARAQWIQARARYDETFTALWIDKDELNEALMPIDWNAVTAR